MNAVFQGVASGFVFMAIMFMVSVAVDVTGIHHEMEHQTTALQQIAKNTTQPIRSETTIAKVDEGVCSTLVGALGKSGNRKKEKR